MKFVRTGCLTFSNSNEWGQVIVVSDSHEFYKFSDVATFPRWLLPKFKCRMNPNVYLYYNSVVHIADTAIIASTLWAHIPKEETYITEQAEGLATFTRFR